MTYMDMETEGVHDLDGVWLDGVQVYAIEADTEEGYAICYYHLAEDDKTAVAVGPDTDTEKYRQCKGTYRFRGKVSFTKPESKE